MVNSEWENKLHRKERDEPHKIYKMVEVRLRAVPSTRYRFGSLKILLILSKRAVNLRLKTRSF